MTLHWVDILIIAAYLCGILVLGFALQRQASRDIHSYFLADRKLPWWALGASGMASNTDIAGTMVIAALIYAMGSQGFFIEIRGGIVLVMAFFMIFMGKWTRRAQVMTLAEWMRLRFGDKREGKVARFFAAVSSLVISIWIISYFAVGGGKFLGELMGLDSRMASIVLIVLAMLYTTASGFYGVVWTDVFQGGMILIAILYVCALAWGTVELPETFMVSQPVADGSFAAIPMSYSEWSRLWPPWQTSFEGSYSVYNLFGVTILFYFLKTCIEGFGGAGGYMSQRYFAAASDREAGLLSLVWICLLAFRWPFVTAFALLAIHYGIEHAPIQDPELVLPTVIANYIPVGVRGLLVACFIAAAMSTFDSIINSSAAYWVKDIYQPFINSSATNSQLMRQSRWASIGVVILGVLFSFPVVNINDIWGWITMAFGSGIFVPLLLRWYWWRYNGYGFAVGVVFGMVAAIAMKLTAVQLPEYMNFIIPGGASLLGCLIGTLFTAPTDHKVLENFYRTTRPFGFWGNVPKALEPELRQQIHSECRWDLVAILFAVPWQLCLFLFGMMFMMKRWDHVLWLVGALLLLSAGLYVTWFRRLSGAHQLRVEDVRSSEKLTVAR